VEEASRGETVEATLWSTVTRLRARGWHISLWEIQRAQDVIAYLFTRLGRPPTDDELYRHLRPILCGRESELAPFSEVFRGSTSAAPTLDAAAGNRRRRPASTSCRSHEPWSCPSGTGKTGMRSRVAHTSA